MALFLCDIIKMYGLFILNEYHEAWQNLTLLERLNKGTMGKEYYHDQ